MRYIASRLLAAALCLAPLPGFSQSMDAVTSARVLPGWRMSDGTHMAALELRLAPGWKTYWRAPGDIGIPPRFDWRGSRNLSGVEVEWPTPEPMDQGGMIAIGYHDTVVLPLHVLAQQGTRDITLDGTVDIGVCRDVCIPMTLSLAADLPAAATQRDARIIAALADRPLTAAEAGVQGLRCTITPAAKGGLQVRAELSLPSAGGTEMAVIEASDPNIWVARPRIARQGDTFVAETRMAHVEGRPFALDRSGIRLTVLSAGRAVDIKGCPGG
ncbi:protein-disulfide reductase DsbD domain-containing protein [Roseovarius arcticus]|uniref:protein-disulfide reductase DsbD domain-containing protein n=1 Tax=Roseovarius arcticus TaxID=2547404 RepID=UPI0011104123|nr:protein-disulfide reductase DsbD domain-containing protein [Roseovarius arcticus]